MEVLDVGTRVFGFADKHAKRVGEFLSTPDIEMSPSQVTMMSFELNMMGSLWQLAAGLVKDLTDPLKSIVNK